MFQTHSVWLHYATLSVLLKILALSFTLSFAFTRQLSTPFSLSTSLASSELTRILDVLDEGLEISWRVFSQVVSQSTHQKPHTYSGRLWRRYEPKQTNWMSRFSQGSVGPRCNRTDSAIQSEKMREHSFKWWWWLIIFLCHHLWQPKKSRKIHSPPVLSRPLWFAVGIWQQVDRVGFRRGQGGPRWCPYRLPSTRGGSLAPRSKCLLVGVECLAGKVRPFEACVCVSVRVRFYRVKIAVAGQVGVSIGHHSGQRCARTGQRRRARSQVRRRACRKDHGNGFH